MRRSVAWEERKCVATRFSCRNLVWAQGLGPLSRQSFSFCDRELARGRIFLSRKIVLCHDGVWAKPSRQGDSMLRHGWPAEGRVLLRQKISVATELGMPGPQCA